MQVKLKIFLSKYLLLIIYMLFFVAIHIYFLFVKNEIFLVYLIAKILYFSLWLANKDNLIFFLKHIFPALLILFGMLFTMLYILYSTIGKLFIKDIYIISKQRKSKFGKMLFKTKDTIYFFTGIIPNLLVPFNSLEKLKINNVKIKEKLSEIDIRTDKIILYIGNKTYIFRKDKEKKKLKKYKHVNLFKDKNKQLIYEIQQKVAEASQIDSTVLKKQIEKNTIYFPTDLIKYMEKGKKDGE